MLNRDRARLRAKPFSVLVLKKAIFVLRSTNLLCMVHGQLLRLRPSDLQNPSRFVHATQARVM